MSVQNCDVSCGTVLSGLVSRRAHVLLNLTSHKGFDLGRDFAKFRPALKPSMRDDLPAWLTVVGLQRIMRERQPLVVEASASGNTNSFSKSFSRDPSLPIVVLGGWDRVELPSLLSHP